MSVRPPPDFNDYVIKNLVINQNFSADEASRFCGYDQTGFYESLPIDVRKGQGQKTVAMALHLSLVMMKHWDMHGEACLKPGYMFSSSHRPGQIPRVTFNLERKSGT